MHPGVLEPLPAGEPSRVLYMRLTFSMMKSPMKLVSSSVNAHTGLDRCKHLGELTPASGMFPRHGRILNLINVSI